MKKFVLDVLLNDICGGNDCCVADTEKGHYKNEMGHITHKIELNHMKMNREFNYEDFVLYAVIFKKRGC